MIEDRILTILTILSTSCAFLPCASMTGPTGRPSWTGSVPTMIGDYVPVLVLCHQNAFGFNDRNNVAARSFKSLAGRVRHHPIDTNMTLLERCIYNDGWSLFHSFETDHTKHANKTQTGYFRPSLSACSSLIHCS
jgi:hypothetical protein